METAAFLTTGGEEFHDRVDIGLGRGPAKRFGRERGDDSPRALVLLAALFRVTLENLVPARRARRRKPVVRPFDEHLADMRVERVAGDRARRVHRADE